MPVSGRNILVLICTYFAFSLEVHGKMTDISFLTSYLKKFFFGLKSVFGTKFLGIISTQGKIDYFMKGHILKPHMVRLK